MHYPVETHTNMFVPCHTNTMPAHTNQSLVLLLLLYLLLQAIQILCNCKQSRMALCDLADRYVASIWLRILQLILILHVVGLRMGEWFEQTG